MIKNWLLKSLGVDYGHPHYDAIFLSEDGLESQGGFSFSYDNNSMYYQSQKNLFGWDCVSILVLNPDSILLYSEI